MQIKEYIVIHDDNKHPCLLEQKCIEWNRGFPFYNDIVDFLNEKFYLNILSEEYFYVLSFDYANDMLGVFQLSHGKSGSTSVGMREMGIFLLLTGADAFYVAHNHPNGNCTVSMDDIQVTNRIEKLAELIDIKLLQHFVIAGDSFETVIETCDDDETSDEDTERMPFQN